MLVECYDERGAEVYEIIIKQIFQDLVLGSSVEDLKAYVNPDDPVFFLAIKMIYRAFGIDNVLQTELLNVLFVLGACGMIFGSITAIKQKVLNKMVSYSSAAQIGYIYLGIGLGPAGLIAATFHIMTHSICKSLLFSC